VETSKPTLTSNSSVRGQAVVITLLFLGIAAAAFAWWWNFKRGRQTLAFFGPSAARLVRTASRVEFLRPPPEPHIDLSRAPGLINARASLLSDASYAWNEAPAPSASPLFTVRFTAGQDSVDLTFDFENSTLRTSSTGKTVVLQPKTAAGWQDYLSRHVGKTSGLQEEALR
jgi:hypothetical protein